MGWYANILGTGSVSERCPKGLVKSGAVMGVAVLWAWVVRVKDGDGGGWGGEFRYMEQGVREKSGMAVGIMISIDRMRYLKWEQGVTHGIVLRVEAGAK